MVRLLYQSDDYLFNILIFIIVAAAVLFSIILHEIAHGLVAHWCGDDTAKINGRLSLNPARHFDPIGALMILFVGFGYAKPVPINPYNFRNYKKGCILVSIAGIVTNLIISLFSSCLYVLFYVLYLKSGNVALEFIQVFFAYLSRLNVYLCFFNLLPFFPLDGFNLIKALCKRENKFTRFMQGYGQYILFGLIIVAILVENIGIPFYFSPLDVYFHYTADYVQTGFLWLGSLIFGGI